MMKNQIDLKNIPLIFLVSFFLIFQIACSAKTSDTVDEFSKDKRQTYKVTFTSLWNATDHVRIPSSAHFSPLVAVTHKEIFSLLPIGELANSQLEVLAETGQTSGVNSNIAQAREKKQVYRNITRSNLFISSRTTDSFTINVSVDHPYLSLVSMIAPSPDWVVGVDSLQLYSKSTGFEKETQTISLYAINAGTEDGDTAGNYSLSNSNTNPQQVIQSLKNQTGFGAPFAEVTIEAVSN